MSMQTLTLFLLVMVMCTYLISAAQRDVPKMGVKYNEPEKSYKIDDSYEGDCESEWAPIHGKYNGKRSDVVCPSDGIIKTIGYSFDLHEGGTRLHSISFTCASALGVTHAGTFGKVADLKGKSECDDGDYISSIKGEASSFLNKIEVNCKKISKSSVYNTKHNSKHNIKQENQTAEYRESKNELKKFDDSCFSTKDRRPVKIVVWADDFVTGIQIQYLNVPVQKNCKLSHLEVADADIDLEGHSFEVIGLTSGFTCSHLQQVINLDVTRSETYFNESELGLSLSLEDSRGLSLEYSNGFDSYAKLILTLSGETLNIEQQIKGKSTTFSVEEMVQYSMGTAITYDGPGVALLVGLGVVYKFKKAIAPAWHHYTCEGGSKPPIPGEIKLKGNIIGNVFFLDYHYKFNSTEHCMASSFPYDCVTSINFEHNNFIANLEEL